MNLYKAISNLHFVQLTEVANSVAVVPRGDPLSLTTANLLSTVRNGYTVILYPQDGVVFKGDDVVQKIHYGNQSTKIQNDVDDRHYTWDGAIFQLDKAKWAKEFKGNYVYLGGKFEPDEIKKFFYPNHANPSSFKYPANHLFRIQGCVDAEGLKNPYFLDEQGNPCFIVAKEGQTTDLTFGRFSECEAYVVDDLGGSSWEVAVFNFYKENFSYKGDSGSCIFNAEGKMVAFLHSGMPRGMSGHVTFGTPAYFVVEQLKKRYPHADFNRVNFFEVPA